MLSGEILVGSGRTWVKLSGANRCGNIACLWRRPCIGSAPSNAPVAQLDRASDYESEGRAFESLRVRHLSFITRQKGYTVRSGLAGDTDRHGFESLYEIRVHPPRFANHLDARKTLQNLFPHDAQLHFGEAHADAAMNPEAE